MAENIIYKSLDLKDRHMLVTVIGGSGFVGRNVVRALAKSGARVRVACRRPDIAGFLLTAGNVGQIALVQANVRYPASIAAAIQGADVVVNCVGLLAESGRQRFETVQSMGAKTVADACAKTGARLIHISALGADINSASLYAKTKAEAEQYIQATLKNACILRPSIIFGSDDKFFNRFAQLATLAPVLPLIGAETKFQPVFVGDVAEMVVKAAQQNLTGLYALGGAEVLSFKAMMEIMLGVIQRRRFLAPVPFALAKLMGSVLEYVPTKPLTKDQVLLLQHDNVVSGQNGLQSVGITPKTLAEILPTYLWRFRKTGEFEAVKA
jgi:uncharacterized protein YbjT (DUF2867 family)